MQTAQLTAEEIQSFYKVMTEYKLEKYIPLLEPHLERTLSIELKEKDNYELTGNSRRCGWPDFPPEWEWPCAQDGKYMNFICQINLSEIAHFQQVLPRKGILYFFLGSHNHKAEGQIRIYEGDLSRLRKFSLVEPLEASQFSLGFRSGFEDEDPSFLLHHYPRKLRFHRGLSLPWKNARILNNSEGIALEHILSEDESDVYTDAILDLDRYVSDPNEFDGINVHQSLFGYEYCQTFEARDFGKRNCEGPYQGVELYSICDHEEFFRLSIDGSIIFVVRQDEVSHCHFSEIFVAIEGS